MREFFPLKKLLCLVGLAGLLLMTYCSSASASVKHHVIYNRDYDTCCGAAPSSFSKDGKFFGTMGLEKDSATVRIWYTRSFALLSALKIPNLENFAISPDNKHLAVIMGDRGRTVIYPYTVQVRDIHSGKTKLVLVKMGTVNASFRSIVYSPDGKYIAADSGNSLIYVWDAATGKQVAMFRVQGFAYTIAFSPNGKTLAALSGNDNLSIWSIAPKKLLHSIQTDGTESISFSPKGKYLAISGQDRLKQLYNSQTLRPLQKSPTSTDWANEKSTPEIAFSPDERYIAFARGRYIEVRKTNNISHVTARFSIGSNTGIITNGILALHFVSARQLLWAKYTYDNRYKITLGRASF